MKIKKDGAFPKNCVSVEVGQTAVTQSLGKARNTDGSDEPYVQPTYEELDTAMKRFEAKQANKRNKSLLDR